MYTIWTQHLKDPKEKEEFEKDVYGAKRILDHLIGFLDGKQRELQSAETTLTVYDSPNWEYKQAHMNGYRSCLKYLKNLIDLDQQKEIDIHDYRKPV